MRKTAWGPKLPSRLTLLSAALVVASFPPWNLGFLIWFCLIPWLMGLRRAPHQRAALIQSAWMGFLMGLGGFYWVAFVLHEFAVLPWPLAVIGMLGFAFFCQPQFLAFGPLFRWLDTRGRRTKLATIGVAFPVFVALAYTGIDWTLPKLFMDTLGHSFHHSPRLRQVADLGGASLLTFIVVLVNLALLHALETFRDRKEPSIWPALRKSGPLLATSLGAVLVAVVYGHFRLGEIRRLQEHPTRRLQAAVLQGNIGDFDKIAAERGVRGASNKVLETFFGLSDAALALPQKPDVLVWPETSYPSTFRTPENADQLARDQTLEKFVRERGVPLLFGGYDRNQQRDYNAFFFLSPKPEPGVTGDGDLQIYRKNILLLFGEYIPLSDQIKFLRDAFPQVGNFGRGDGPSVLEIKTSNPAVGNVRASPIICYEAIFPNYVIAAARKGSELILNITNDSWFGPWGEPELHLALTVFRSIETRLPQLRATNTGISALILPDGSLGAFTGVGTAETMNVAVPLFSPPNTLMKTLGDWFGIFALISGLTGLALRIQREKRTQLSKS